MSETYYKSNRRRCISHTRKWQIKNFEKERIRKKKYYSEHREEICKFNNEYNKLNSVHIKKRKREYSQRRKLFTLAKYQNKRYKHVDDITAWDLWKIAHRQKLICPLTGNKLTNHNISVDHIIPSSKGGRNIPSNIRLTTRDINWFKRTMTDHELLSMCKTVVNHLSKECNFL